MVRGMVVVLRGAFALGALATVVGCGTEPTRPGELNTTEPPCPDFEAIRLISPVSGASP